MSKEAKKVQAPSRDSRAFLSRVRNHPFFVSKIEFVKELLEVSARYEDFSSGLYLIAGPRGSGKKVMMEFLQAFLSHRDRLLTEKIFNSYLDDTTRDSGLLSGYRRLQGAHPVISISFGSILADNLTFKEFFSHILLEVRKLCKEYLDADELENHQPFKSLVEGWFSKEKAQMSHLDEGDLIQLQDSLLELSQYLHKKYGYKKVAIIIKDYDAPLLGLCGRIERDSRSFQERAEEWNKIRKFIYCMLHRTFKDNTCVLLGVVTGIFCISKSEFGSSFAPFLHHYFFSSRPNERNQLCTHLGFSEEELQVLFKKTSISNDLTLLNLRSNYGGYFFAGRERLNSLSVSSAILGEGEYVRNRLPFLTLRKIFRRSPPPPGVREKLEQVFTGKPLSLDEEQSSLVKRGMTHLDFQDFFSLTSWRYQESRTSPSKEALLFGFLLHFGFVTATRGADSIYIKVPGKALLEAFRSESLEMFPPDLEEKRRSVDVNQVVQVTANSLQEPTSSLGSKEGLVAEKGEEKELPLLTYEGLITHEGGDIDINIEEAMKLFTYFSGEGYCWSTILEQHLYSKDLPEKEKRKRKEVINYLKKGRKLVDHRMYSLSVQALFHDNNKPEKSYDYCLRDEDGSHCVFDVKRKSGNNSILFTVKIKLLKKSDLNSNVKAKVQVNIPSRSSLTSQEFVSCVMSASSLRESEIKLMDRGIALQVAIVFHFNRLNMGRFKMSSVISRSSCVCAEDFFEDIEPWKYAHLSADFSSVRKEAGEEKKEEGKLFEEILKNKIFFNEVKAEKARINLAGSLLPVREYIDLMKGSWEDFCLSFWDVVPASVMPVDFLEFINSVTKLVNEWYLEKKRKMLNSEEDFKVYIESLLKVACIKRKINHTIESLNSLRGTVVSLWDNEKRAKKFLKTAQLRFAAEEDPDQKEEDRKTITEKEAVLKKRKNDLFIKVKEYKKLLLTLVALKNNCLTAQIKANFFTSDACPSLAAAYYMSQREKFGSVDSLAGKRQILMGSICYQVGRYLLCLAKGGLNELPKGELLCRTAKYGERLADMLCSQEVSCANGSDRSLTLIDLVSDLSFQKRVTFMMNRDKKLFDFMRKNSNMLTENKVRGVYRQSVEAYKDHKYGKNISASPSRDELSFEKEFDKFRCHIEPKILMRLMKEVIARTIEAKFLKAKSNLSTKKNGGASSTDAPCRESEQREHAYVWGNPFQPT